MENKKNYCYIGLVGRNQTGAVAMINNDNLDYKAQSSLYKFNKTNYYECMYILATKIVNTALERGINMVIYSIDAIIDNSRLFFKEYKKGEPFDYDAFADKCLSYKRKFNGYNEAVLQREKKALAAYFKALANIRITDTVSIKFEKAKEADQLLLNIPEGVNVNEGDIISFENGKTKNGIKVYGWPDYNRKTARVKVRYEAGMRKPIYFIYRNDNTMLGRAKSDMLRYLWGLCPSYDREEVKEFYKVA